MTKDVNQPQRASLGWEVLIKVAKEKGLIRYGMLGKQIGIHHRPVRFVLGLIQDYCLANQLPPLTILVGNDSGLPGDGFIAWDADDIEGGLNQVYNYNWENLSNPFGYAKGGLTEEEIINALLANPEKANDVYAKIKVRGTAQLIFRKALLKAYDCKCSFCDFSFDFALQASHIVPWSKSTNSERLDIRNGILLCATHHRLFDNGFITVSDNYSINYYDPHHKDRKYSEFDKLLTSSFHKKKMKLPKNKKHWPTTNYLKHHRENANA